MQKSPEYYHVPENWESKREIVQEIPYPIFWTLELAKKWAEQIPHDIELEGHESPLIKLDLTQEGYGVVFIKNEAERSVNPTGTMKDRIGRSCAAQYRYDAKDILESRENDPAFAARLEEFRIPRYSMLTAGNAGMALAKTFETLNLPPPKLLLDKSTSPITIYKFKNSKADVYLADLSSNPFNNHSALESPLSRQEILLLTNNSFGVDLTSNNSDEDDNPHIVFYQNLAKQIFREQPDEVYVPYGSGALFGEILVRQRLDSSPPHLDSKSEKMAEHIAHIKLFGAEPESSTSIADKLSAPAKPFPTSWEQDMDFYKTDEGTNPETGVVKISEKEILAGYELLKKVGPEKGIETEASGSAGLALYMKRWREGKINRSSKIIIVNTGKGIISDSRD